MMLEPPVSNSFEPVGDEDHRVSYGVSFNMLKNKTNGGFYVREVLNDSNSRPYFLWGPVPTEEIAHAIIDARKAAHDNAEGASFL